MKFTSLRLRNFLSFGEAKVRLDDQGVVLVTGRTDGKNATASNGAGKSSLWDALVWCLYGKTVRDIGVDDVINERTKGGTSVKLKMIDNRNRKWAVIRTRGVKSSPTLELECQGRPVTAASATQTQKIIDGIIGLDYQSFTKAVVFDIDSLRFARMSDKDKKAILDKILGLEIYEQAHFQARTEMAGLKLTLELTNTTYSKAKERYVETKTRFQDLLAKREQERSQLDDSLRAAKRSLGTLLDSLPSKERMLLKTERRLRHYSTAQADMKALGARAIELKERAEDAASRLQNIQNDLIELKDEKDPICKTCKQAIHNKSAKLSTIKSYQKERGEVLVEMDNANRLYRKAVKQRKRLKRTANLNRASDLQMKAQKLKNEINEDRDKIRNIKAQIEISTKAKEYSKPALVELKNILKHAKKEMRANKGAEAKLEKKIAVRRFWELGFGQHGIRSMIMGTVTPFLNERAEHYAEILTGGRVRIRFQTNDTLKSGRVIDSFNIVIRNKDGASTYAGNSAGERQRIDLCIALALKDLARSMTGRKIDLMVFDEVFERVDAIGCDRIIELLRKEGAAIGSCYVITHNENLKQYFPKVLEIVKENGLSRITDAG